MHESIIKGVNKLKCIVFEGIDGSGKTTQAKMLCDYLCEIGIKCKYKHIFDSKAGAVIRDIFLNNEFSNTVEILLLCASRSAFFDEIHKEEDDVDVIILDRLYMSILAMQGKKENDIELISNIKDMTFNENCEFYTFYLDTNPQECSNRMHKRTTIDRIESKGVDFHKEVYDRYERLIKNTDNVYVFDGNSDIYSVQNSLRRKVLELI